MNLPPHHTIFSYASERHIANQDLNLHPGNVIHTVNGIYSPKKIRILFEVYVFFLVLEYLMTFLGCPFENISNRSSIFVLHSVYNFFMFVVCVVLLPFASSTIPSQRALKIHYYTLLLQVGNLILSLLSLVKTSKTVLGGQKMILTEYNYDHQKTMEVDMTLYIGIISVLSFAIVLITVIWASINVILYHRAYFRLCNRIDRRDFKDINPILSAKLSEYKKEKPVGKADSPVEENKANSEILSSAFNYESSITSQKISKEINERLNLEFMV